MPKGYNQQFIIDVDKFRIKTEKTINDTRRLIAFDLFSNVIDRTPIYFSFEKHSGTTKFNWKCSINTLSAKVLKGKDKKGTTTKARMLAVLERVKDDDTIYFANSMPGIFHLEDGLYPKSVSKGSWNKQTKSYEIRSVGGFSKGGDLNADSSHGMVKLTLAEYPDIYRRALRKAQAQNP